MDSLKILRKGQSVSQYNKTKSKRDQYSCQKKCFLWRVKKNSDLAFSQVCMKTSQKSWTLSVFWGLLQLRYNNTKYNGSPSFQPGLWYINLKMSLLNTKKISLFAFIFLLSCSYFLWAKISWRKKTFLLRLVQIVLPPQRNEYREGRKYKR